MTENANVDWSGYPAPISSKKHLPPPPDKLTNLEVGVGPIDETAWKPGRKVVAAGPKSSESLLGGPVPESSNWTTEAQSASAQTKTAREQMTESGRSMFVRGKATVVPAYELARPFDETVGARLRDENPYTLNDNAAAKAKKNEDCHPNTTSSTDPNYSLVGYRSGGGARSFLEGLGTEVAASMYSSNETDGAE